MHLLLFWESKVPSSEDSCLHAARTVPDCCFEPRSFTKEEGEKIELKDALDDVHQESGKLMDRRSESPDEAYTT